MRQLRIYFRRISHLASFIKGDSIVLNVVNNKLVVDAGNVGKTELKEVAGVFFSNACAL